MEMTRFRSTRSCSAWPPARSGPGGVSGHGGTERLPAEKGARGHPRRWPEGGCFPHGRQGSPFLEFVFLTEAQLIYSAGPVSAVQQSDSVTHIQTFFFIHILSHYGFLEFLDRKSVV